MDYIKKKLKHWMKYVNIGIINNDTTTMYISHWANEIKLKIMNKNKRHNDLEVKCKKSHTTHSPTLTPPFFTKKRLFLLITLLLLKVLIYFLSLSAKIQNNHFKHTNLILTHYKIKDFEIKK